MTTDARKQYMEDPMFHLVVDEMLKLLREAQLTPYEMRQAATLACIHYEQTHPCRSEFMTPELKEYYEGKRP